MRLRLFAAGLTLAAVAAAGFADNPVPALPPVPTAPPAVVAVPVPPPAEYPAALPPAGPVAPPPIVYSNTACSTPVVAAPRHAAKCDKKPGLFSKIFGRLAIGEGTSNPVTCGCFAAEKTFVFGSCRQFFTPGRTCGGCELEYGHGWKVRGDNCVGVGSYLNR